MGVFPLERLKHPRMCAPVLRAFAGQDVANARVASEGLLACILLAKRYCGLQEHDAAGLAEEARVAGVDGEVAHVPLEGVARGHLVVARVEVVGVDGGEGGRDAGAEDFGGGGGGVFAGDAFGEPGVLVEGRAELGGEVGVRT